MCGFFGIVGNTADFDIDTIKRSAELIRHRGPDEFEIRFFDNAVIASARLKVVGSDSGEQPIVSNLSDCLVYNGEIFNFEALQAMHPKIPLSSRSDTENLYNFLNFGLDVDFVELEGQFAFANWSISTETLTLARDRNGEKPLYYRIERDYLVFSSSADAITNLMDKPLEMDKDSLSNYLSNGWLDSDKAFFKGIVQLKPGQKLIWDKKTTKIESFARGFKQIVKSKDYIDGKVKELEAIFADVVNRQLDADIDVGIFLSGGLDSSLIAMFAAERSKNLNAFSIELPHQNDDALRSLSIAKTLGINHHVSVFDKAEFDKSLDIYMQKFDTPVSDSGVLPLISLVRNAKKYSSVALTGEGGDELFAGYPWAYSSFVQSRFGKRYPFFENIALRMKRRLTNSVSVEQRCSNRINANLNASQSSVEVFERFASKDNILDKHEIQNMGLAFGSKKSLNDNTFGLREALYWDRQHYLVNDLLVKADRSSMALGFELRLPFLSDAIIDFAENLPPRFLINHKDTKIILRKLAEARMPEIGWRGQKYGLGVSDENIASYVDLDKEVRDLLALRNIKDAFSQGEVIQINENFLKNSRTKWMAFMLLKWMSVRV